MKEFFIYLTEYYHYLICQDAYVINLAPELFMRVSFVDNGYDLERPIAIIIPPMIGPANITFTSPLLTHLTF